MTSMIFLLSMAAITLVLAGVMAFIPNVSSHTTPLGVRVPSERAEDPAVKKALSRFRTKVMAAGVIAAIITLLAWSQPLIASMTSVIVIAVALYAYIHERKSIIAAKQNGNWFSGIPTEISGRVSATEFSNTPQAEELDHLSTARVPWIYILGATMVTTAAAFVTASLWNEIPQTVATHWGPNMEADAWADKSITSVFFPTMMSAVIIALFLLITWALTRVRIHPRNDRTTKGSIRTSTSIAASNQGVGALLLALIFPFSFMQVVNYVPQYETLVPMSFILTMIGVIVGIIALMWVTLHRISRVDKILRTVDFGDATDSPDNDEFYKWGMFYVNPDDPAVMVEKRFGVGMDFNYAHWQAKAFLAFVLLILVGSLALPFLL